MKSSFPERGTTQRPSQPNLDLFGSEFSEKIYYIKLCLTAQIAAVIAKNRYFFNCL
jgi:hypothetical protein